MYSETNIAISANGLSKCYRLYAKPIHRLKQALPWQREPLYQEFWALRDINLTLQKGQTLGVIGRNGSGKSTMLQLICGTLTPSEGSVQVNGRIGALLELGSGFNPEFTGLENVRLNAAVLGLKQKEIEAKLDDILAFADVGDFIDQPVKLYSSGMVVRLAFAVQAHIDPSILIVDEALAVGDELFQKKCFARLENLKQKGTSILLVSHSCSQINQHCDQVLLLNKGRHQLSGDPHYVTAMYQRLIQVDDCKWAQILSNNNDPSITSSNPHIDDATNAKDIIAGASIDQPWFDPSLQSNSRLSHPINDAKIVSIEVFDIHGNNINTMPHGTPFDIKIELEAYKDILGLRLGCFIANHNGKRVTGQSFPKGIGQDFVLASGESSTISLGFLGGLWPGLYFIGAGLAETNSDGTFLHRLIDEIVIRVTDQYQAYPIGDTDLSRNLI